MRGSPKLNRILLAAAVAMFVFATSLVASWWAFGRVPEMYVRDFSSLMWDMHRIANDLSDYKKTHGEFPDSLDAVPISYARESRDPGARQDFWGRSYHYAKTKDGFELYTLGRDGIRGGRGLDADVVLGKESEVDLRVPLSEFLSSTAETKQSVYVVAAIAGVCAAAVFFVSGIGRQDRPSGWAHKTSVVVVILSSIVVAVVLAMFHVAASQSGH